MSEPRSDDAHTARCTRMPASFLFLMLLLAQLFTGCFIIRPFTGASVDFDQLQKAREAKVLQVRHEGADRLSKRLAKSDPIDNADIAFYFSEGLLNKAASQLDNTTGWLDSNTSYNIKSIRVTLYNGSAIATINMAAYNHDYDVDVGLLMDCILAFKIDSEKFYAVLEPFNVVPSVRASGIISSFEGIIGDALTMKLSSLSENLPPIQFPVDFNNQFPVQAGTAQVRSGINMDVSTPAQTLLYKLALKEVLIFRGKLFLAMNVKHAGVAR